MSPDQEKFLRLLEPNLWSLGLFVGDKLDLAAVECMAEGLVEIKRIHGKRYYNLTPMGIQAIWEADERLSNPESTDDVKKITLEHEAALNRVEALELELAKMKNLMKMIRDITQSSS